jgi:hypothetical protein
MQIAVKKFGTYLTLVGVSECAGTDLCMVFLQLLGLV